MGRRKIEIQPLTDDRNRTVTFVKRKAGLFKKAHELAVLCQVDLAVIIVGNNNRVYEFLSVDTNQLMDVYKTLKIHESKLPENYGNYKKKAHVGGGAISGSNYPGDDGNVNHAEDLDDGGNESEYESESPAPQQQKRRKTQASPVPLAASIYLKQNSVHSRFAHLQAQQQHQQHQHQQQQHPLLLLLQHLHLLLQPSHDADHTLQRPVLRVQIPLAVKEDPAKTVTALDNIDSVKDKEHQGDAGTVPPGAVAGATPGGQNRFFGKFKSPDFKKNPPHLPLPVNKLQTLSPLSSTAPQLPSGMPFFSLLPQPSPGGQYAPAGILPTPVFNQVFNAQFANTNGSGMAGQSALLQSVNQPGNLGAPVDHDPLAQQPGQPGGEPPHANNAGPDEPPRFRPPLQFAGGQNGPSSSTSVQNQSGGGDQGLMSSLPSRYVNDIFPSPSTLYPLLEWPSGMTPYTLNMPHFFVAMPGNNGQAPFGTPVTMHGGRTPLQGGGGSVGGRPSGDLPEMLRFYKK